MDEKLTIMQDWNNPKLINKDITTNEKCLHKSKFVITKWKQRRKKREGGITESVHIIGSREPGNPELLELENG